MIIHHPTCLTQHPDQPATGTTTAWHFATRPGCTPHCTTNDPDPDPEPVPPDRLEQANTILQRAFGLPPPPT